MTLYHIWNGMPLIFPVSCGMGSLLYSPVSCGMGWFLYSPESYGMGSLLCDPVLCMEWVPLIFLCVIY